MPKLLGPQVASSGEAIAVAFQGRPNTQTFGDLTWGSPTGIEGFTLSVGAVIGLTVGQFADRTGRLYGPLGGLVPDESGGEVEARSGCLVNRNAVTAPTGGTSGNLRRPSVTSMFGVTRG